MNLALVVDILVKHHANLSKPEAPYPDYLKIVNARDQVIQRFQPEFANPASLSEATFREFLKFENNQHWTGLHRPTTHSMDDMTKLRDALTHLFDENVPIATRLDTLIGSGVKSVRGISMGILTPLLLVRFPDKYGVWNAKSEAALKVVNLWPNFKYGSTAGDRYEILNSLYLKLSQLSELDLWCLDGLWHVINEKSKLERDEAFAQLEAIEKEYLEGKKVETSGYRLERSKEARDECIAAHGLHCMVCGFNFLEQFGELGFGYIHVHHREDLASAGGEKIVSPKKDLVPVCPNCHAMLHKGAKPARSIDDLREIIRKSRSY